MRTTTAFLLTGILAVPGVTSAQNCTNDARQVVSAIYRQVLERNPNASETTNWANRLSSGEITVRQIANDFAVSAEHRQRFGNGTSDGERKTAVTTLYRHLLGREPDASGLQAHVDACLLYTSPSPRD